MSTNGNSPLFRAAKGLTSPDPTPLAPEPLTWAAIVELARTYRPEGRPDGEERVRLGMLCKRIIAAAAARSPADPSPEPQGRDFVAAKLMESAWGTRANLDMSEARIVANYLASFGIAATPTAGAGGLDVERLARAIRAESVWKDDDAFIEVWHDEAVAIAAEYAALAPVVHRPTPAEPDR